MPRSIRPFNPQRVLKGLHKKPNILFRDLEEEDINALWEVVIKKNIYPTILVRPSPDISIVGKIEKLNKINIIFIPPKIFYKFIIIKLPIKAIKYLSQMAGEEIIMEITDKNRIFVANEKRRIYGSLLAYIYIK